MRRRRRRRFLWLPTLGISGSGTNPEQNQVSYDSFTVTVPVDGQVNSIIKDVLPDHPADITTGPGSPVTANMADFLRTGYMLRRIVGNVFSHLTITASGTLPLNAVIVTYAMWVARIDELEAGGLLPIGAQTGGAAIENYDPQFIDNVREPYIFVKNWVFGNILRRASGLGEATFPMNNGEYGSAMEGTFMDQKTLRRVDGDNRLWHSVSVRRYPIGDFTAGDFTALVNLTSCLRYLGRPATMARTKGSF